jgi:two-component system chemotaxis sensor kinase CheA
MNPLDEAVKEFLVESYENLDRMDRDLVSLEKDPQNRETLASIFRTIHTIKGTCGFFDFARLGAVTHAGENLLSRLRDGKLQVTPDITSGLLALVDSVRALLACIESSGRENQADYTALIAALNHLQHASAAKPAPEPEPTGPTPSLKGDEGAGTGLPDSDGGETFTPAADVGTGGLSEGNIRVNVGLLDKLMTLVGELVLARNQVLQFAATEADPTFLRTSQRLNLITTELQEGVMKTRMLPIGNVWAKFPRVVRDLALACGKQVRIDLEGQETELDRSIIEAIKDPLTHLVRNAIDHGLEPPEVRRAQGKPPEGHLFLRACHESGQVNIEVTDDGAGIDPERVKRKAIDRGFITREQAARMSDRDLFHLVFLPGFSTAGQVTSVSGRGVGMDVVQTNIGKIGGTVDLQSRPGQGTTVKIKIPLTLAIIPALLVTSGGDRYAIPQVNLLELVRLEGDEARRGLERVHGTPVYRLRGNLLPLVYLSRELRAEGQPLGGNAGALNIVVLQADDRSFGLVVEGINDTEEIVVKPLGPLLKEIPLFAGATILGDGRVALILDVLGIARSAGVVAEVRDRALPEPAVPAGGRDDRQAFLLLGLGPRRLAVPLSLVARLEEIPRSAVEITGGQEAVQYRGRILPLVWLSQILGGGDTGLPTEMDPLQVVVHAGPGGSVGLVVDRILDVVEAAVAFQPCARHPGLAGTAVIQGRVTDLLDVPALVRAADPASFEPTGAV